MAGCRGCSAWARCGANKGECDLLLAEIALHGEGIAFIAMPGDDLDAFEAALPALVAALPGMRHVAAAHLYRGDDLARIERLDRLAQAHGCTILATNDVHYHAPEPAAAAGRDELHPREGHAGRPRATCSTPMPSGI